MVSENESDTTKESKSSHLYHQCQANEVILVRPDEVGYTNFQHDLPCMAATNLNGAFVVVMVSVRAGLMTQIAQRASFDEASDQSSQKKSIQHVEQMMKEMRTRCLSHRQEFDQRGTYVVVAYAKFQGNTNPGFPEELERIKRLLPPKVPVRTISYVARHAHEGDAAPSHEVAWLDSRTEQGEGGDTASPVVWVGEEMIDQNVQREE